MPGKKQIQSWYQNTPSMRLTFDPLSIEFGDRNTFRNSEEKNLKWSFLEGLSFFELLSIKNRIWISSFEISSTTLLMALCVLFGNNLKMITALILVIKLWWSNDDLAEHFCGFYTLKRLESALIVQIIVKINWRNASEVQRLLKTA